MRTIVIDPPLSPVVTWEQARARLALDDTAQEDMVVEMIAAATAHLDGPSGWLGRALGVQTLEARFDGFHPCHTLRLPYPPLIEVQSITWLDSGNAPQTLDPAAFTLLGNEIEPAFGSWWPNARWGRETVRVRYTAGYPDGIPGPISAAILLMVGDLFANRETTLDARASGAVAIPMPTSVEALVAPYRVWL